MHALLPLRLSLLLKKIAKTTSNDRSLGVNNPSSTVDMKWYHPFPNIRGRWCARNITYISSNNNISNNKQKQQQRYTRGKEQSGAQKQSIGLRWGKIQKKLRSAIREGIRVRDEDGDKDEGEDEGERGREEGGRKHWAADKHKGKRLSAAGEDGYFGGQMFFSFDQSLSLLSFPS